mmetsp:Transcript_30730/g.36186  ORF Transcript_30730/g.36186 Transcript_30730/m.36186 type:complete len:98 (-) Transcript_30730:3425-3718(-)
MRQQRSIVDVPRSVGVALLTPLPLLDCRIWGTKPVSCTTTPPTPVWQMPFLSYHQCTPKYTARLTMWRTAMKPCSSLLTLDNRHSALKVAPLPPSSY